MKNFNKPKTGYDWGALTKNAAKVLNEEAGVDSPASAAKQKKPYYITHNDELMDVNDPEWVDKVVTGELRQKKELPTHEASPAQMEGLKKRLDNARAHVTPPKIVKSNFGNVKIIDPPKVDSWKVIKQSMNKEELAEWYKDHPEDRPLDTGKPFEPDPYLTERLGDDWYL